MKKIISLFITSMIILSMCAVPVYAVETYTFETSVSDMYAPNTMVEDMTLGNSNAVFTPVVEGTSTIFTPSLTTTNNQQGPNNYTNGSWDASPASHKNYDYAEVTYDVTFGGTIGGTNVLAFGLVMSTLDANNSRQYALSIDHLLPFSYKSTSTSNTHSIKYTVAYGDGTTTIKTYVDGELNTTINKNYAPADGKTRYITLIPYGRMYYGSEGALNADTKDITVTISNLDVNETYSEAQMEDISGNYLCTKSKDVNYFIPNGFETASLTLNGQPLAEFSANDGDSAGSYKTTIDFTQFNTGNNIPLVLMVNFPDGSPQTKTVYVNILGLITESSMEDISGDYAHYETIEANYIIPHTYKTAKLTINGEIVDEYDSAELEGGNYSSTINLDDYDCVGDNIPVTLTVTFDDAEDSVITYYINVYYNYVNALLEDVTGYYINSDTVTFDYTIPTVYREAVIKLDDTVIKEIYSEDTVGGEYTGKVDLSALDFADKSVDEFDLKLEVTGTDGATTVITRTLTVYKATNSLLYVSEDYEGDNYVFSTPHGGEIDRATFDSSVFKYEFTNSEGQERCLNRFNHTGISKDWIFEVECDFYFTDAKMQLGLELQDLNKSFYSGYPQWFTSNGVVAGNDAYTYTAGKWYNFKQRIIPRQYTDNGVGIICLYIDGKYAGSQTFTADLGFTLVGLDLRNGGGCTGLMYIDNVTMTGYAPQYNATVISVDESGNKLNAFDYSDSRIAIEFDQAINSKTISEDTITLKSFNGSDIAKTVSFDEEKNTVYIKPEYDLIPDSEYTVSLSKDVCSKVGTGYTDVKSYSFTTKNKQLYIDEVNLSTALNSLANNSEFTVDIDLHNDDIAQSTGYIYAALYIDGRLRSINSVAVSGNSIDPITLKTPDSMSANRKVIVFYVKGQSDFSPVDKLEIQ